jgi:hypothetical protein
MSKDDSYFPRGRVLYKAQEDLFLVRMDRCIPTAALPKILRAFNLSDIPSHKLQVAHGRNPVTGDHHYQCQECAPLTRRRVL